jgi:hypothetical protein
MKILRVTRDRENVVESFAESCERFIDVQDICKVLEIARAFDGQRKSKFVENSNIFLPFLLFTENSNQKEDCQIEFQKQSRTILNNFS